MVEFISDLERVLAAHVGVQGFLEALLFEMKSAADEILLQHRQEGHAETSIDHGRIDWYLILSDERGQKAALSIEYGRAGYIDEDGRHYGAMEPIAVLHTVAGIPLGGKGKIRFRPRRSTRG